MTSVIKHPVVESRDSIYDEVHKMYEQGELESIMFVYNHKDKGLGVSWINLSMVEAMGMLALAQKSVSNVD